MDATPRFKQPALISSNMPIGHELVVFTWQLVRDEYLFLALGAAGIQEFDESACMFGSKERKRGLRLMLLICCTPSL
jgi:hypothetical protein